MPSSRTGEKRSSSDIQADTQDELTRPAKRHLFRKGEITQDIAPLYARRYDTSPAMSIPKTEASIASHEAVFAPDDDGSQNSNTARRPGMLRRMRTVLFSSAPVDVEEDTATVTSSTTRHPGVLRRMRTGLFSSAPADSEDDTANNTRSSMVSAVLHPRQSVSNLLSAVEGSSPRKYASREYREPPTIHGEFDRTMESLQFPQNLTVRNADAGARASEETMRPYGRLPELDAGEVTTTYIGSSEHARHDSGQSVMQQLDLGDKKKAKKRMSLANLSGMLGNLSFRLRRQPKDGYEADEEETSIAELAASAREEEARGRGRTRRASLTAGMTGITEEEADWLCWSDALGL